MGDPAKLLRKNFVFIVQELVKCATAEHDRLAEEVFASMVGEKKLRFLLLKEDAGYRLPSKIAMSKGARKLTREDNSPLQLSLFEQVAEECVNTDERSVAWYLEAVAVALVVPQSFTAEFTGFKAGGSTASIPTSSSRARARRTRRTSTRSSSSNPRESI